MQKNMCFLCYNMRMNNILYINACVRQNSRTKILADYLISKLNCNVKELTLETEKILPLTKQDLEYRDILIQEQNYISPVFEHARLFANADEIVIAAPFWDFSFPASLKCFIERINVNGITFMYKDNKPVGLCKAKRLYFVTTSGGKIYNSEYGFGYLKNLANNFYGINEVFYIKAEELDIINADVQQILDCTKLEIDNIMATCI